MEREHIIGSSPIEPERIRMNDQRLVHIGAIRVGYRQLRVTYMTFRNRP